MVTTEQLLLYFYLHLRPRPTLYVNWQVLIAFPGSLLQTSYRIPTSSFRAPSEKPYWPYDWLGGTAISSAIVGSICMSSYPQTPSERDGSTCIMPTPSLHSTPRIHFFNEVTSYPQIFSNPIFLCKRNPIRLLDRFPVWFFPRTRPTTGDTH